MTLTPATGHAHASRRHACTHTDTSRSPFQIHLMLPNTAMFKQQPTRIQRCMKSMVQSDAGMIACMFVCWACTWSFLACVLGSAACFSLLTDPWRSRHVVGHFSQAADLHRESRFYFEGFSHRLLETKQRPLLFLSAFFNEQPSGCD